jgi:TPR repeat protein
MTMSTNPSSRLSKVVGDLVQSDRFQEAYEHCLPLAEAGDAEAQMYVGWMHHVGKGVEKDLEEAERWYRRALPAQSPRVEFFLASIYWEKGQRDKENEWLERAASKRSAAALYELGRVYRFGSGVPADPQKSRNYYEDAARLGHVFACRSVAGEMCKGRRGLWRVPVGLLMLVTSLITIVRIGGRNPPHDLILRVDGPPIVPRRRR